MEKEGKRKAKFPPCASRNGIASGVAPFCPGRYNAVFWAISKFCLQ
jgi:hypothetical protein